MRDGSFFYGYIGLYLEVVTERKTKMLKDTRETVEQEYHYAIFDDYADRVSRGEMTFETAMEIYQHLVETTEKLGATAIGKLAPNRGE